MISRFQVFVPLTVDCNLELFVIFVVDGLVKRVTKLAKREKLVRVFKK